ncbi:hypothetical protein Tco_0794018 [Tanacetum coccineum]
MSGREGREGRRATGEGRGGRRGRGEGWRGGRVEGGGGVREVGNTLNDEDIFTRVSKVAVPRGGGLNESKAKRKEAGGSGVDKNMKKVEGVYVGECKRLCRVVTGMGLAVCPTNTDLYMLGIAKRKVSFEVVKYEYGWLLDWYLGRLGLSWGLNGTEDTKIS